MRFAAAVGLLGLACLCHGQSEEARRLVAKPMDRTGMARSAQLIRTGDPRTQLFLAEYWAKSSDDLQAYLRQFALASNDLDKVAYLALCESNNEFAKGVAKAIGTVAGGEPKMLRTLARVVAGQVRPPYDPEAPGVCGLRWDPFYDECFAALRDLAERQPSQVRNLLADRDPAIFVGAAYALYQDHLDWVTEAAFAHLRRGEKGILGNHALQWGLRGKGNDDDLRRVLATWTPKEMEWSAASFAPEIVERLYPGVPFSRLPASARYLTIRCSGATPETEARYQDAVFRDPDPDIASYAARYGQFERDDLLPALPKLLKSKRFSDFWIDQELQKSILEQKPEVWIPQVLTGGPEMAWTAFSLYDKEKSDVVEVMLRLMPGLERAGEESSWATAYHLADDWPRFKPVLERMLRSKNVFLRRPAARALAANKDAAPTYVKWILSDPDAEVRGSLLYADSPEALPILAKSPIRQDAFEALRKMAADGGFTAQLREAASSSDPQIAEYARWLLSR